MSFLFAQFDLHPSLNTPLLQPFHHLIWCFIDLFSLLLVLASQHEVKKKKSLGQQRMVGVQRFTGLEIKYMQLNNIQFHTPAMTFCNKRQERN